VYCRGTPAEPDELERHDAVARNSPCVCNDLDALERTRAMCSRVPSAAPR
jgi:hypothetical protein